MFLYYKNSFLASVLSILGCIMLVACVMMFEDYEITELILPFLIGIALNVAGKMVSMEKSFKKWWKSVKEAGYEEQIKQSFEAAQLVYSKYPKKRTLKEIEKLNPAAAALLAQKK